ncbi:MAG: dienelactone hydrolase family protein [Gammaproteobacteria bacterium]|nr:dienelactone hydrolase family protein [Gammaproteobacteria bacterium]
MHTSNYLYYHGEQECHAYLAYDDRIQEPRPAVLVAHDWSGRNAFACQKAEQLAKLGYVGFAIDLYGQGRTGSTNEEKMALMEPLMADRRLLRARMLAALGAVSELPEVDSQRVAAIGFCFGGLSVLDLARSGAKVNGVVSFHGLLNQPEELHAHPIGAKVLVLHGYDDPMVTPVAVNAFADEMTRAGVDWQVHMYGQTQHAFTNPLAHDAALGTMYNEQAERRSMQSMVYFLDELFSAPRDVQPQ